MSAKESAGVEGLRDGRRETETETERDRDRDGERESKRAEKEREKRERREGAITAQSVPSIKQERRGHRARAKWGWGQAAVLERSARRIANQQAQF